MLTIALTGGIASGKSLVSDAFAKLGAPIIDSDLLAREVVEPETPGLQALIEEFGPSVVGVDGTLNRPALRQRIFEEPHAREALNAIVHPLIGELAAHRRAECEEAGHAYVIQVIPLLVETGQQVNFDRVLVVDVLRKVQLERLVARDGCDAEQAEAILAAQVTREQRLDVADDVLENDQEPEHIAAGVAELHRQYLALASPG